MRYVGRFAPSPTGPLHAGSLVAALASWLDARAFALRHPKASTQWLVRMEDLDEPRCPAAMTPLIVQQLARCGLVSDAPMLVQSTRTERYAQALQQLIAAGRAYPCACSRKDIEAALALAGQMRERHGELPYPGTCRQGLQGRTARAWRFAVGAEPAATLVTWTDRWLGAQQQDVAAEVGDFVLRRADGYFAYQLAVVVDDADQGVTHVVRGADLADNTPRQLLLQRALGYPAPQYLHTPLVLGADGEKLSKQNGAAPLNLEDPLAALGSAAQHLQLPTAPEAGVDRLLRHWASLWAERWWPRPAALG